MAQMNSYGMFFMGQVKIAQFATPRASIYVYIDALHLQDAFYQAKVDYMKYLLRPNQTPLERAKWLK